METLLLLVGLLAILAAFIVVSLKGIREEDYRRKQQYAQYQEQKAERDAKIVCAHCQTKGHVSTTYIEVVQGVSGAKLTAALLTLGVSLLIVGLSRKEWVTQAQCSNCGSKWRY
jgi:hypothetical protein